MCGVETLVTGGFKVGNFVPELVDAFFGGSLAVGELLFEFLVLLPLDFGDFLEGVGLSALQLLDALGEFIVLLLEVAALLGCELLPVPVVLHVLMHFWVLHLQLHDSCSLL